MPFIDSKITVSLTPEKEEAIKTKLGEAIQILNKSETYLMVGFEDNYDLYMGGSKLDKGAYVSVSLFGQASWIGNLTGIVKSLDYNRPSWLKEPKGIVCNCLFVFCMLEDVGEVDNVERGVGGVVTLSGSLSP